jgi:predicted Rossmann fold nucleotide-binding protein DprA/Smf involved in DNA uptake
MNELTAFTRATLLLTCALRSNTGAGDERTLTIKQFGELLEFIEREKSSLEELLGSNSDTLLAGIEVEFKDLPIRKLISRGFQLGQALDNWFSLGLWILDFRDARYPTKLLSKLGKKAPPYLVGAGNITSLTKQSLGVVGSRNVTSEVLNFAFGIGGLAAKVDVPIVSGGARGVDQSSMQGSLESGGSAIGVVADSLARLAIQNDARNWVNNDQLTFISVQDPFTPFSVGSAMQRNKYIYALSDATLIVESNFESGGTWAGASEQLKNLNYSKLFVPSHIVSKGISELRKLGATDCTVESSDDLLGMFKLKAGPRQPIVTPSEQLTIF